MEVFDDDQQRGLRTALAAWCARWREHRSPYALRHLVSHRLEAASDEERPTVLAEAAATLCDPAFQAARVEADDAAGLLDEIDRVARELGAVGAGVDVPALAAVGVGLDAARRD
jgi:hypothetical protein